MQEDVATKISHLLETLVKHYTRVNNTFEMMSTFHVILISYLNLTRCGLRACNEDAVELK